MCMRSFSFDLFFERELKFCRLTSALSVRERRAQYEQEQQNQQNQTTSPRDNYRRSQTEIEPRIGRSLSTSSPRDEAQKLNSGGSKAAALINQFKSIEAEASAAEQRKLQQRPQLRRGNQFFLTFFFPPLIFSLIFFLFFRSLFWFFHLRFGVIFSSSPFFFFLFVSFLFSL